jgi:hypothetical protein
VLGLVGIHRQRLPDEGCSADRRYLENGRATQDEPDAVLRAWEAVVLRDLQEFSDQELIELTASDVGERKKAIAEEIWVIGATITLIVVCWPHSN